MKFLKILGLFWRNSKYLASNLKATTESNFLARRNLSMKASSVLRKAEIKNIQKPFTGTVYVCTCRFLTSCIKNMKNYQRL